MVISSDWTPKSIVEGQASQIHWSGGSGLYDIHVEDDTANVYVDVANLNTTQYISDKLWPAGTYTITITDRTGTTVSSDLVIRPITHDVAIWPIAGDETKTDKITFAGPTQTITLNVGDTYTGEIHRVATDDSNAGNGYGSTITPASSDTVASYTISSVNVVITAKAPGDVIYLLESGDTTAHKNIHVIVNATPIPSPAPAPKIMSDEPDDSGDVIEVQVEVQKPVRKRKTKSVK